MADKEKGVLGKYFILIFIPILAICGYAGYVFYQESLVIKTNSYEESQKILASMAEDMAALNARLVAQSVKLYLQRHPSLPRQKFNDDPGLKKLLSLKLGDTGYPALYAVPDQKGVSSTWVHPNKKIIGIDMNKLMQKVLGDAFGEFWKVYSGAFGGKISQGYYRWMDKGNLRQKFMVCAPVEGTPYVIASTAYLFEFDVLAKQVEDAMGKSLNTIQRTGMIAGGVLLFFLLLGFIILRK